MLRHLFYSFILFYNNYKSLVEYNFIKLYKNLTLKKNEKALQISKTLLGLHLN
jgi:hypothetical protein